MSRRKHRKLPRSFVALDRRMLKSPEFRTGLSASAKIAYIYLRNKCVGYNNGDIELHYCEMRDIMAPATLAKAFRNLEEKGWIERTKLGGLYRYVNKYKLTGRYDGTIRNYSI